MKKYIILFVFSLLASPLLARAHEDLTDPDHHMMDTFNGFGNMMYNGSAFFWLAYITSIVWLIVGILAIVWLAQRINKK